MAEDVRRAMREYGEALMQSPPGHDDRWRGASLLALLDERDALEKRTEAADNLAQKVEWAYNDACFTAPEDHERMNRQWRVMMEALRAYRELVDGDDGE